MRKALECSKAIVHVDGYHAGVGIPNNRQGRDSRQHFRGDVSIIEQFVCRQMIDISLLIRSRAPIQRFHKLAQHVVYQQ